MHSSAPSTWRRSSIVSASCPAVTLTRSADGMYVSTELEYYFRVNGAEYRPTPSTAFRGRFTQYRGLFDVCLAR